jgi:hypothetical protein
VQIFPAWAVKFINAVRRIFVNDSKSIACILAVLLIAVVGISLALQGWKSRLPAFDSLVDIDNVHELIVNRHIPDTSGWSTWQVAEGVSAQDTFRIRQSKPLPYEDHQHLDIPQDDEFHVLEELSAFQFVQRSTE